MSCPPPVDPKGKPLDDRVVPRLRETRPATDRVHAGRPMETFLLVKIGYEEAVLSVVRTRVLPGMICVGQRQRVRATVNGTPINRESINRESRRLERTCELGRQVVQEDSANSVDEPA